MRRLILMLMLCLSVPVQATPWLAMPCCDMSHGEMPMNQHDAHQDGGSSAHEVSPDEPLSVECERCATALCGTSMPATPSPALAVRLVPQHAPGSAPVLAEPDAPVGQLLRPPIA